VRNGDVDFAGTTKAWDFNLSADQGSIDVTGTIDASGPTGGNIDLAASGSVTVGAGAVLNAQGENFDSAGKGGAVTLSAGTSQFDSSGAYVPDSQAEVTVATGSEINLSVVNDHPIQLDLPGTSFVTIPAGQEVSFPYGTPGDDQVTFSGAGTIATAGGATTSFGAGYTTSLPVGATVVLSGGSPATILFAAAGTGGSIPLSLPSNVAIASEASIADLTPYNSTGTLVLRAPQVFQGGVPVDVQIAPIDGTIVGPSSIVAEGYQVFTPAGGSIDSVESAVQLNGAEFAGGLDASGNLYAGNTQSIVSRLTSNWGTGSGQVNGTLSTQPDAVLHVQPGAEIDNPTGSLTLQDSWDLSTLRFGPNATDPSTGAAILGAGEPGILTLRAAGNVVFAYDPSAPDPTSVTSAPGGFASLSDGFAGTPGAAASPNGL
jgi:hypothetical protein